MSNFSSSADCFFLELLHYAIINGLPQYSLMYSYVLPTVAR